MASPVQTVEPLFADDADAERLVALAHRYGRYRVYGEAEQVDTDLGAGLLPRHDSVRNFLRSGGSRGPTDLDTLAARTSYFREEYAYDGREHLGGVDAFLHNPALIDAAVALYDRPVIEPAIAFANLMVPGQELAVHTDVPEFRGASRKNVPQWLLVVMHHAGLFDRWRMPIATAVTYFGEARGGAFAYYADDEYRTFEPRHNTGVVLDTDSVFHGVDRVEGDESALAVLRSGQRLFHVGGARWELRAPSGDVLATFATDDLRYSVSWKGYCFADEAERDTWASHRDDLSLELILGTLEADLDVARPASDADFGRLLIERYITFPS